VVEHEHEAERAAERRGVGRADPAAGRRMRGRGQAAQRLGDREDGRARAERERDRHGHADQQEHGDGEDEHEVHERAVPRDEDRPARPHERQRGSQRPGLAEGQHGQRGPGDGEHPQPAEQVGQLRGPERAAEPAAAQQPLQRDRHRQRAGQRTRNDLVAERVGQRVRPARDRDHAEHERRALADDAIVWTRARQTAHAGTRGRRPNASHQRAGGRERAGGGHAGPRLEHDRGLQHVLRRAAEAGLDHPPRPHRVHGRRGGLHAAAPAIVRRSVR
jgi:hypothetical protein